MTRDEIKERARELKVEGDGRSNRAVWLILAEELPEDLRPSLHTVSTWCRGLADQRHNRRRTYTEEETRERKRAYMREYARKRRQDPEYVKRRQAYMREYYER